MDRHGEQQATHNMGESTSVLTRLDEHGPQLLDPPALALVVALVLALSLAAVYVMQKRQAATAAAGKKSLTRKMSNMGMTTLVTEIPTNLSIPVTVLTMDGVVTVAEYAERLRKRILHDAFFLRFRSVVRGGKVGPVNGFTFVEIPDYDVSRNVVEHTVEEGETVMSYVESLVNSPLDFDKPLWEMHVISDPKVSPQVTNIVWKVHHCLGDGASLSMAMAKLSDQSEMFDAMLAKRAQAKRDAPKKPRKPVLQVAKELLLFAAVAMWSLVVITRQMAALVLRREPITIFKRSSGTSKRLSCNMTYSVAATKAVGKQFGATVNDVMLSVVAGAMRRTMLAAGETVAPQLVVRCAIPVDMRSTSEVIHTTSNRFSSLVIDLLVGEADPVKRLLNTKSAMNEAKNSLEKYFVYASSFLVAMLPAPLMRQVIHFTTGRMSVAVSNVRASVMEMALCGKQLTGFFGFVPPPPHVNLGVAILSMGDDLGLNVLVDPSVGIDAKQFLTFAKEDFDSLQTALAAKAAKKEEDEEKKTK